jgi:hypothetical protein
MRKISVIVLGIILLSGCAGLETKQESTINYINYPSRDFGMHTEMINNKVTVMSLNKGGPASSAGVKPGDIWVSTSFKGERITSKDDYQLLPTKMQPGDHVLLVMNRNGNQIDFNIEPEWRKILPTEFKIYNLLAEKKEVTIAVIVSEVKNSFRNVPSDWADSIRNNLQSGRESKLISSFESWNNFSMVDRSRLKHILDEFQFSQSGFISDKLRAKIGEMTGATHILDMSFSRFGSSDGKGVDDQLNARLIEIETGKVLAVDQITTH